MSHYEVIGVVLDSLGLKLDNSTWFDVDGSSYFGYSVKADERLYGDGKLTGNTIHICLYGFCEGLFQEDCNIADPDSIDDITNKISEVTGRHLERTPA